MGPEFIGKAKDNKTKNSPDLSSKAVEKPIDEVQTVDETQTSLGTLSVDSLSGAIEDKRSNGRKTEIEWNWSIYFTCCHFYIL